MPVIDDGLEAIEVTNTLGLVIGTWLFNPADFGIIDRYNEALPELKTIFEPLQNANINANGEGADEDSWKTVTEAKERLYAVLGKVFGPTFADAFFPDGYRAQRHRRERREVHCGLCQKEKAVREV